MALHGPHQTAQKSTTTGMSLLRTSFSKEASVALTMFAPMGFLVSGMTQDRRVERCGQGVTPCPFSLRDAILSGIVGGGRVLDRPWSGTDYLNVVSGPVDRFPPLRVLFLAHRVAATGLITLVNIYGARGIWVQNGVIAGLAGFPDLLSGLGLKGEPGEDAIAMVTRGITSGQSPDRVITALSDGVAAAIAGFADLRGADVRFRLDARPPPQLLPPLDPFPRLLSRGLRLLRPPERLRPLFGPRLNLVAIQSIPDDAPESRWALDPTALRVLREAGRAPTLGELLGSGAPSGATWLAVDLLLQLGLLELVTAAARPVDKTAEKPVDRAGDRSVDRSVDRALDRSIDRSVSRSVAPPRALDRSVDRSVSRNLAAPQDRSVDASVSGRSAPRSARPPDLRPAEPAAVIALPGPIGALPSRPPPDGNA